MSDVTQLKEKGNAHYRSKEFASAAESYTRALEALDETTTAVASTAAADAPAAAAEDGVTQEISAQLCALWSNRAACYLALQRAEEAVADCEHVLARQPGHTKALYRRGQAYAQLAGDNLDAALKDFVHVLHLEPTNKQAAAGASSVRERLQMRQKELLRGTTVPGLLSKIMQRRGADVSASAADMRRIAGLTSDPSKALHVPRERAVPLVSAAAGSTDVALAAPALTVLANVLEAGAVSVATQVLRALPLSRLGTLAASPARELAAPASVILSAMAASGISRCAGGVDDAVAFEAMQALVASVTAAESQHNRRIGLECLAKALVSRPEEPEGRPIDPKKQPKDLKSMAKSLRAAAGLDKDKRGAKKVAASWRAVEAAFNASALGTVLSCCCTADGVQRFCALKVLDLLFGTSAARCWMEMQDAAATWIADHLTGESMEQKEQGMAALACIASSCRDVGLEIAKRADVLEEVLMLAEATRFEGAQLSAAELCAHLASDDPAKCFNPLGGVAALRKLSAHQNPRIAVRAVTALAKLANVNTTHRVRVLADGRVTARVIAALGSDGEHAEELRSWAVEAMAYLSLYPEVKEPFDQTLGISHVVDMLNDEVEKSSTKHRDDADDASNAAEPSVSGFVARGTIQFGLVSIICNLTSTELSKDEHIRRKLLEQGQEATVEQVEKLRKLNECKDPNDDAYEEPPEKLTDERVIQRMRQVVVDQKGVAAILSVVRGNSDVSDNTKEMISKTMANCAAIQTCRGTMVQQGVVPLMVDIAKCENKLAQESAAQTLAKIAISTDPRKFRSGAEYDMIVPLLKLTQSDQGLHQFEACMALTNLASIDEPIRECMIKHGAFQNLQYLMTVDDERIMRAATECLCNLVACRGIVERLGRPGAAARNELKMFVVLSAEAADYETRRAAAGALATICGCCDTKVLDNLLSAEASVSYGDVVYVLGEMLTMNEEMLHRGMVALAGLSEYKPAADRIKGCVLNVQRDSESEDTAPVQLLALLEMVAAGGLTTNTDIAEAAQAILRNIE
eukprot:SAG25_NODE_442_length_7969_cov_22.346203_5_plen_1031_part_00